MTIADAQKEVRSHFAGGFYGQLVSSVLWATSASLATFSSPNPAILSLVLGGFLIFPLTEALVAASRTPALSKENALRGLGMQIAFVLPTSMLLLVPVVRYNTNLFFPAMMILLGAHYIPFVFLYGMLAYAGLAALLVGGGTFLALASPQHFSTGAWCTAILLLLFAILARGSVEKERSGRQSAG